MIDVAVVKNRLVDVDMRMKKILLCLGYSTVLSSSVTGTGKSYLCVFGLFRWKPPSPQSVNRNGFHHDCQLL